MSSNGRLDPGVTGGGRVLDRRGHPVKDAAIYLKIRSGKLLHLALSDSTGAWSSDELPRDLTGGQIRVRHPKIGVGVESHGVPIENNLVTVIDQPQVTTLKIVDPRGQPVEGVRLAAGDAIPLQRSRIAG